MLIDASEPLTEQDLRILTMVTEAGRALVIAYNKWDLTDEERRHYLERRDRAAALPRPLGAPGEHLGRRPAVTSSGWSRRSSRPWPGWEQRISTGQLNAWLNALVAATPPPLRGGKQPRVLFATQAGTRPPHFVLFTTGFLEETYRRFIERRLREDFGFAGTPVKLTMRAAREARQERGPPGR